MNKNRSPSRPPRLADRFFSWFCCAQEYEILKGDLEELYFERVENGSQWMASLYYWLDVFDLFRPFVLKSFSDKKFTNFDMFRNYFKVTYRNFFKQKGYSFINISGLAIGLACFILIFLYIQDELSFDKFHDKSERIYRVVEHFEDDGVGEHSASQPFPVGPALVNDFQGQIEQQVRFFNFQSPTLSLAYPPAEKAFNESAIFYVDSTFFQVFDFVLLEGDKNTALDNPNSILLTKSMAEKYFPKEQAMGRTLELQGNQNVQVTGILADPPTNKHFDFDFLVSFSTLKQSYGGSLPTTWYWNPCWTYITLRDGVTTDDLELQFPAFVKKYFPGFIKEAVTLELQPLEDIHLKSKLDYEIEANSNMSNVYIFSAVALFVLLIATINFINLSTARANKRAKEVGVRKSLGSGKAQLINQFIFESVMMTVLASLIGLLIVGLSLPYFNELTEKKLSLIMLLTPTYSVGLSVLILSVGILSGFYPAFVLSSFNTVLVLKNAYLRTSGINFRKVLVTLQFTISIMLIIGTIVAITQLNFLQNEETGFNEEHVVMVPVIRSSIGEKYVSLKNAATQNTSIKSITAVEEIVGAKHQIGNYRFEGMEKSRPFPRFFVRTEYLKTMGIDLVAGRDYDINVQTDDSLALVVNEKFVDMMGWGSPQEAIGKRYYFRNELKGRIVGVAANYNFVSKHHPIGPLVIDLNMRPSAFNLFLKYMAVRVDGDRVPEALAELEVVWKSSMPNRPFDYFFLDDRLADSYKSERKLSAVTIVFSFLAILVACLGLFGLATFSVEQRIKEIGVRKVLGITTVQILNLLSREFVYLILLAFVLATPITYLLLDGWLNNFAYRISISFWPFLFAGVVTVLVSFVTVLYHAMKASLINPVDTLKYE